MERLRRLSRVIARYRHLRRRYNYPRGYSWRRANGRPSARPYATGGVLARYAPPQPVQRLTITGPRPLTEAEAARARDQIAQGLPPLPQYYDVVLPIHTSGAPR